MDPASGQDHGPAPSAPAAASGAAGGASTGTSRTRDRLVHGALLAASLVWLGWIIAVDPGGGASGIPCPFTAATGVTCPGCGLQRAIHHLAHGRVSDALAANALAPLLLVLIAWMAIPVLAAPFMRNARLQRLADRPFPLPVVIGLVILVLAYWIWRI